MNSVSDSAATFSRNVRELRERLGLSQEALADRLGVHVNSVSAYERGEKRPRAKRLEELAAILGVSARELLFGTERQPTRVREGRTRLPPQVYAVVHEYLERLADAGVDEEMQDEALRLMTDWNYSKLHKATRRPYTEDDQIKAVRVAWDAIEITLRDQGVKL